jgi:hypothetical protein
LNTLRKFAASIGVTFVALFPLLAASPAHALYKDGDYIQFTYYWEDYSFEVTDATLEITVTNNFTNKIGGNGEVIDMYRITVGDDVLEKTEKHDAVTYTYKIVGTKTVTLGGIDNGYWGGNYGPSMSWTTTPIAPEPDWWQVSFWEGERVSVVAPAGFVFTTPRAWYGSPTDPNCGADVSEIVATYLVGNSTATFSADNGLFGDPCGGVVKTLRMSTPVVVSERFLNPPLDVNAVATGTDLKVTWKEPIDSGTAVEHYALVWTYDGQPGWGVGVWGNEFVITGLPENKEVTVTVRADNDTLSVYSANSVPAVVTTGTNPVVPPVDPPGPVDPGPVDPVEPPVDPVDPVSPEPTDPGQGSVEEPKPPVDIPPSVPEEPTPTPQPPIEENVTPEPPVTQVDPATIDPTTLSPTEVVQLQEAANETLSTSEPGSPEYEKALEQLWVAAEADDLEVNEELAAVPVVGAVAVALTDAINFVGNVGADMSPKVREESKKIVISAVVAVGAAVSAATGAATTAAAAAASTSSTRKND